MPDCLTDNRQLTEFNYDQSDKLIFIDKQLGGMVDREISRQIKTI